MASGFSVPITLKMRVPEDGPIDTRQVKITFYFPFLTTLPVTTSPFTVPTTKNRNHTIRRQNTLVDLQTQKRKNCITPFIMN